MAVGNPNYIEPRAVASVETWAQRFTTDNIVRAGPLLARLNEKGRIKSKKGGKIILEPIRFGLNTSHQGLATHDTFIPFTVQGGITDAEYRWSEYGETAAWAMAEMLDASGDEERIDLMQERTMQALDTWMEEIPQDLYTQTAYSNAKVEGLGYALDATGIVATVGNIACADNSWWRPYVTEPANDITITRALNQGIQGCTWRNQRPDFIVTQQAVWNKLWDEQAASQRYINEKMADIGFDALRFRTGTDVVWDRQFEDEYGSPTLSDGTNIDVMFLNTNFITLRCAGGTPMKPIAKPVPVLAGYPGMDQGIQWYLRIALTYNALRVHGRYTNWDGPVL